MVVPVIKRSAWGALPPKNPPIGLEDFSSGWIWHYNGPPTGLTSLSTAQEVASFLRGVQRYHQVNKVWNDIAYSFAIDPACRVYECRGWGIRGGHTEGHNSTGMAIFFTIGGDERATPEMIRTAELLMLDGVPKGYSNKLVRPHSALADTGTPCPGADLTRYLTTRVVPGSEPEKEDTMPPMLQIGSAMSSVRELYEHHRRVPISQVEAGVWRDELVRRARAGEDLAATVQYVDYALGQEGKG